MINSLLGFDPIYIEKSEELQAEGNRQNKESIDLLGENRLVKPVKNDEEISGNSLVSNKEENQNAVNFKEIAEKMKAMLDEKDLDVEFSYNDELKKMIMQVIDNETEQVVRQIPPEITLKIARLVAETLENGQITNAKV